MKVKKANKTSENKRHSFVIHTCLKYINLETSLVESESELVELIRTNSREAFNYLYENYNGSLYNVIFRMTNEVEESNDILQTTFVKIWGNIDSYDRCRGRLYTWMVSIARHCAIDYLRGKYHSNKSKSSLVASELSSRSPATELSTDTIGLRRLISKMDVKYQMVVELAYYQGHTFQEIADCTDLALGTVKTHMRMALRLLRKDFILTHS